MDNLFWIGFIGAALALAFAWIQRGKVMSYSEGTEKMQKIAASIREILGSDVGADIVYECSGHPASVETCVLKAVKPGGQVMLIGTVQQPITFTLGTAQIFEIDFQSSFVYLQEEVEMYLQMLAAGKIAFSGMVTDIVSLDNCQEQGLGRKDRASQLKILIAPDK